MYILHIFNKLFDRKFSYEERYKYCTEHLRNRMRKENCRKRLQVNSIAWFKFLLIYNLKLTEYNDFSTIPVFHWFVCRKKENFIWTENVIKESRHLVWQQSIYNSNLMNIAHADALMSTIIYMQLVRLVAVFITKFFM